MRVLGMISGTSFDAVDVALADLILDGPRLTLRPIGALSEPFPSELRRQVAEVLPPRPTTVEAVCRLDTHLGQLFATAAERGIEELGGGRCDLVVSHGQTIYHWVEDDRALGTLQLGQPAWIAARTGRPVVADLRARDLAHGGHGAPLASTLDVLLLGADAQAPRAALNLGGIANLTVVGGGRDPVAFDTGPANGLLDVAVEALTDGVEKFDQDGRRAARGQIDDSLLAALLDEPYYDLAPPKSTGKERFHLPYLRDRLGERPIDEDVLATLVALTAETVARACDKLGVVEVIAAGGGVANPTLMAELRRRLDGVPLSTIERYGVPADAKEAYLFAVLGFLTVNGLPGVVPSCTGSERPAILGAVVPGAAGFPVVDQVAQAPTRLVIEAAP